MHTVNISISSNDNIIISDAGVTSGTNYYEGTFPVAGVPDAYTFSYTMTGTPANAKATGYPEYARESWDGSSLRCGMFDDQNGMYFEYDGNISREDVVALRSSYLTLDFWENFQYFFYQFQ